MFDRNLSTPDNPMRYLDNLIDLVFSSGDLADMCRRLVHSRELGQAVIGAHVYGINSDADLLLSDGYGFRSDSLGDVVPGDSDSPCAKAVRSMRPVFSNQKDPILAVPCTYDRVPNACLVVVLREPSLGEAINEELLEVFAKATGFFASVHPIPGLIGKNKKSSYPTRGLTSRQLLIVQFMADSLTNAAIARELLVSESTVRQETVRIFRELGVTGRTAAVSRARELNLING